MKHFIVFIPLVLALNCLIVQIATAQTIDLEQANPEPAFQDADAGAIALGDIDNDGDLDFIATGKGGPIKTTLYRNDGVGNFTEVTGTPFVDVFSGSVGFADLNNDGFLDLLITGNTSSPIATTNLYLNNGSGNFTLATGMPFEPSNGGGLAFGDVNNDNMTDVILTGYSANGDPFTALYLNNGNANFTLATGASFLPLKNSSVEIFDMDNDNDLDIILAGRDVNENAFTKLYRNDGTGNFTEVSGTAITGCDLGDIDIADADNDGDMDILISGEVTPGVNITELYANDGTGTFSLVTGTPFPGTIAGASSFADFDNDGDVDVFIAGAAASGVKGNAYENLGNNSFILADSLAGAYASSTAIGDIDGDNDLDLIIAGTSFLAPTRSTKTFLNVTPTTNTSQKSLREHIKLFPNPNDGQFIIEIPVGRSNIDINISNAQGQVIHTKTNIANTGAIAINASLASGIYFVEIRSSNGDVAIKKMMIK